MRINKLFSNYGICSRKETNTLIEEGRILVNGIPAILGQWVELEDNITLDGELLVKVPPIYIAFNKPQGVICSNSNEVKSNIRSFLNFPHYIFPIGRLDKDSEGLLLLTNDGDLANNLINSDFYHEKEYIVTVNKPFTQDFLENLSTGVSILDTITRPCTTKRISENTFSITLTQGLNRQIRRMCLAFGYRVIFLQRIRIVNISLSNLPLGTFRFLSTIEVECLKNSLSKDI